MECLAELSVSFPPNRSADQPSSPPYTDAASPSPSYPRYIIKEQPGRALPYLLRLRRPDIFDFIRERNLFTDVRDQALLLVEFDMDLNHSDAVEPARSGDDGGLAVEKPSLSKSVSQASVSMSRQGTGRHGKAIELLVDHYHSIPVSSFYTFRLLNVHSVLSPTISRPGCTRTQPAVREPTIPLLLPRCPFRERSTSGGGLRGSACKYSLPSGSQRSRRLIHYFFSVDCR